MRKVKVAEYARLKGLTKPQVYLLLDNELKDKKEVINGTIYIVIDDNSGENKQIPVAEEVKDSKEKEKTAIKEDELSKAQKEIERLREELNKEREHNREAEKRLLDMMEQVIELTKNSQILIARTQEQQQRLLETQEKNPPEDRREIAVNNSPAKKMGLFRRIFANRAGD